MAFNKDLPAGSTAFNQGDDAIRANNYAIEAALNQEHIFVTGGEQTGYHKFLHDTEANIEATYTTAGAFAFATDATGYTNPVPYFYDGTSWYHGITEETLTIPNDWTAGQYSTPNALTPGATVASDWDDAEVFTLTIGNDPTQLSNPSNLHAGKHAVRYYVITQSTPASVLTFGTYFNGSPVISDVDGSVSVLQCVQEGNTDIRATFLPAAATATVQGLVELATDAEAATGTDATRAVTPDNLGQNFDDTWDAGYVEIVGTGILIQWMKKTLSTLPVTLTWPTAFASSSYVVTASYDSTSAQDYAIAVNRLSATQISAYGVTVTTAHFIGIGLKP